MPSLYGNQYLIQNKHLDIFKIEALIIIHGNMKYKTFIYFDLKCFTIILTMFRRCRHGNRFETILDNNGCRPV